MHDTSVRFSLSIPFWWDIFSFLFNTPQASFHYWYIVMCVVSSLPLSTPCSLARHLSRRTAARPVPPSSCSASGKENSDSVDPTGKWSLRKRRRWSEASSPSTPAEDWPCNSSDTTHGISFLLLHFKHSFHLTHTPIFAKNSFLKMSQRWYNSEFQWVGKKKIIITNESAFWWFFLYHPIFGSGAILPQCDAFLSPECVISVTVIRLMIR